VPATLARLRQRARLALVIVLKSGACLALARPRTVTSSSAGDKLVAGVVVGYLYTSTDYGVTWSACKYDSKPHWLQHRLRQQASLALCCRVGGWHTAGGCGAGEPLVLQHQCGGVMECRCVTCSGHVLINSWQIPLAHGMSEHGWVIYVSCCHSLNRRTVMQAHRYQELLVVLAKVTAACAALGP
jgi:hypothetical protein